MWFNVIHVQEYAVYVYPDWSMYSLFFNYSSAISAAVKDKPQKLIRGARPSQQQRETAGAPADNCDRTHHWRSRYRCRDANSNRAQLWAALCIELMTQSVPLQPTQQ